MEEVIFKKCGKRKPSSDGDGPALATGDISSRETDPPSPGNRSTSPRIGSEVVPSPPAFVQDDESLASGSTQQSHPGSSTELEDAKVSKASRPKESLDFEYQVPLTSRLPVISLGDETCPMMPLMDIVPSVTIDSAGCFSHSVSISEESLEFFQSKKVDNLEVNFSPGKRKKSTSSSRSDKCASSDSESNPESTEKPRQKKSFLKRLMSKGKSPLTKKKMTEVDSETKTDKSPKDSRSKPDKSPTCVKKERESPSKMGSFAKAIGIVRGVLYKKGGGESEQLCAIEDSGKTEMRTKEAIKEVKPLDCSKDVYSASVTVETDPGCGSASTLLSLACISTDSPTSDVAQTTNASDPTAKDMKVQETETPNSESDDEKMDEK